MFDPARMIQRKDTASQLLLLHALQYSCSRLSSAERAYSARRSAQAENEVVFGEKPSASPRPATAPGPSEDPPEARATTTPSREMMDRQQETPRRSGSQIEVSPHAAAALLRSNSPATVAHASVILSVCSDSGTPERSTRGEDPVCLIRFNLYDALFPSAATVPRTQVA